MANQEVDINKQLLTDTSSVCEETLPRLCKSCYEEVKTIKTEYEEYKENSTAYENELECLNRQTEELNNKLCITVKNLQTQNEMLEMKLDSKCIDFMNLQTQFEETKTAQQTMLHSLIQMETENDNLKQKIRELKLTVDQKEEQIDNIIERCVLAETELEINNHINETILSLEDENKKLKKLLATKQNQNNNNNDIESLLNCIPSTDEFAKNHSKQSNLNLDKCNQLRKEKTDNTDSSFTEKLNKSTDEQTRKSISEIEKESNENGQDLKKEHFKAVIDKMEQNKKKELNIKRSTDTEGRSKETEVKELKGDRIEEQKATSKKHTARMFKKTLPNHSIHRNDSLLINTSNLNDKSSYQSNQSKSIKGLFSLLKLKKIDLHKKNLYDSK